MDKPVGTFAEGVEAAPKEKVVRHYPRAYNVRYMNTWCVYQFPQTARPRGFEQPAITLGVGNTAQKAWRDALLNVRFMRRRKK